MNTIIVWLAISVFVFLVAGSLIAYALKTFNSVKAGANIGRTGFFIEAKGKKK